MKFFLLSLIVPFVAQSLEYEVQLENENVRVSRIVVAAGEQIGLHRDEFPQVVIALKGGTITRIEADGSTNEVVFPTNKAVYRSTDPVGVMHRSTNKTSEPIELIVTELKKS